MYDVIRKKKKNVYMTQQNSLETKDYTEYKAETDENCNLYANNQTTGPNKQPGRKVFLRSFKNAVDKVKLKLRVISALNFHDGTDTEPAFRSIFINNEKQSSRRQTVLENSDIEEKRNILKDLPEMDDKEVAQFTSTQLVGALLDNWYFQTGILATIITNSVIIAVETDRDLVREYKHVFATLDQCFMTIFICEILLKWYHGFGKFWKKGWNVLDFVIVVLLLTGPLLMGDSSGGRGVIVILRVLRAFRSLRSISSLPGLQVVVQTILQSIPDMTNIVLLLVIIMLVFSVIGITMFREVVPQHFGDLSTSMFSLFVCVTQDGWIEIFEAFQSSTAGYYIGGGLFLMLFISVGAFIFANLVVAVVVTNLECAVKDVRNEEQQQAKEMELKGKLQTEDQDIQFEIARGFSIPEKCFEQQTPLTTPSLEGVDVRNIEHYFVILSAMEDNLSRYKKLKQQFSKFFDEVSELNENAVEEGVIANQDDDEALKKKRKNSTLEYKKVTHGGDIITNLITLEENQMITSKGKSNVDEVITNTVDLAYLDKIGETKHQRIINQRRSSRTGRTHKD